MSPLRLIGRLVALFIMSIFIIVTPGMVIAYNAQETALRGNFFEELFSKPDLFEEAIPDMAAGLVEATREDYETRDMPIAELSAQDWEAIIYAVAPPETMQKWAQDALEGFRDWPNKRGRFLNDVILPFGQVRQNLVDDPEQTVLHLLTQAQPACGSNQEPLGDLDSLIPQCRPRDLESFYQRLAPRWREQSEQVWRQLLPQDIGRYPDDISLADFIEMESDSNWDAHTNWRIVRLGLQVARWFFTVFILSQCLIMLGIIALLAARNGREVLRWVGTPVGIVGLFVLVLAFLFLVGAEVGTTFTPDEEVPIGLQEVFDDTIRAFVQDLWQPMAWQGGVLLMVGLGLWTLSFFAPIEDDLAPLAPMDSSPDTASPKEIIPADQALEEEAPPPSDTA